MSLDFIKPVNELLEKVKELTGKDIEFIEKDDLPVYAGLKLARKHMPAHLLFYKTEHDEVINHLVAHECGHALRMFSVSEEKRLIPYSDNEIKLKALTEIEPEIQRVSKVLPFEKLTLIVNLWYSGLVSQVTNFPSDIMIEKWLFDDYPALRSYQLQSYNKQHQEAIAGLSKQIREITPRQILDASNVMNYAFFRIIGMHFGINYVRPYNSSPYFDKGKKLAAMTASDINDYGGDIEMVTKWADFLNLSGWFAWRDFESTPEGYEKSVWIA